VFLNKKLSILIYSLASGGAERVVSILLNELKDKYPRANELYLKDIVLGLI